MRCQVLRCHYNDDGYCRQPDYANIDKNGVCEQMDVKKVSITEKYKELRNISNEAYTTFNKNPTESNSTRYGIAIEELRDFCCTVIDSMVENRPDITDNIFWEED